MTEDQTNTSTLGDGAGDAEGDPARTVAVAALVAATAIWGSTFVVTKLLLDEAAPFFIAVVRFAIAFAVLWPLVAWRGGERVSIFVRPEFVALGLLGVVGNLGLQNLGLVFTGAADAALIVALTPVLTAALAGIFLRERLARTQLAGIVVSILGVGLITGVAAESGAAAVLGDLLIAASTLSWAGYTLIGKRLAPVYGAAAITTGGIAWGVLFLVPLALVETAVASPPDLSALGIAALLYLGIAASAITFLLWNYALNSVGAAVAGTFVNLIPVFGLGFALLAGESVSVVQLAGGAAVAVGIWLAAAPARSRL